MTHAPTHHGAAGDARPFDEWKRLQRQLVEKEKILADIAVQHACGEASAGRLDEMRREVELLRDLAQTALETMLAELQPEDRA